MTQLCAFYLVFLSFATVGFVVVRYLRGKDELLSLRNFFLAGFVIFQLSSGVEPMLEQFSGRYSLMDWDGTSLIYCLMATGFLVSFLVFYSWGLGAGTAAKLVPTTRAAPGLPTLILLAVVLTFLSAVFRFSVNVPLVSTLAGKAGPSFAAIASGLVAWLWAKRLFNPVMAAVAIAIILANLGIQISGAFGRRSIVAIGGCVLWGMYYSHWRDLPRLGVLTRLGLAAAPPVIVLAAFTSVRSAQERPSLTEQIQSLASQSSIRDGLRDLASGQGTVPVSMWLIENYPERFEHIHLLGLKYFFYYPIPRMWWSEKPVPLSTMIADKADLEGVSQDVLKIGPGVVGHAAAEGGWYVVIVYGAAFAFLLKFFDSIALRRVDNPFVVLPIGSALGQVVGMPRGEISAFAMNYVLGVVLAYISIIAVAKALELFGWREPEPEAHPEWLDPEWEPEDADAWRDGYAAESR